LDRVQIKSLDSSLVIGSLGSPSDSLNVIGDVAFDVKALTDSATTLDSFSLPVTITYQYLNEDISGFNESTLWMYHYHGGAWVALDDCQISTSTKTISCTAPNFSIFSLFAERTQESTPTPPTPSISTPSRSQGTSVQTRVKNLISMGNTKSADDLKKQYSYLFPNENQIDTKAKETSLSPAFNRDLKFGMTGADVKKLQQYLNNNGYVVAKTGAGSKGKETTTFGPATRSALIKFQKANKITPAIGYFGPVTRAFVGK
jgi:hypothetical protein